VPRAELLVGFFLAWLAVTLLTLKDRRYDMGLMPYLAIIGTGWIVHLPRAARFATIAVLVLAVGANTLSSTFGVGEPVQVSLVSTLPNTEAESDRISLYNTGAFGVAGPQRDGDIPALFGALRSEGVHALVLDRSQALGEVFSELGIIPLARMAGLGIAGTPGLGPGSAEASAPAKGGAAVLAHPEPQAGAPPPCTRLDDGSGVYVIRVNPATQRPELFCPFPHPHFYSSPLVPDPLTLVLP
jgi:hypothetical protein